MRILLFLCTWLTAQTLAAFSADSVERVFVHASGKSTVYVLQLQKNGRYDYCRYTQKKSNHDYGTWVIRKKKIFFKSENRKHGFNSVGNKSYFFTKKGLYKKRSDAWLNKNSVLTVSDDNRYFNDWSINPLNGKSILNDKSVVAENKSSTNAAGNVSKEVAGKYIKSYYLKLSGNFTPGYTPVLENNYCGPECYCTVINGVSAPWNSDTNTTTAFGDYETVIHESVHSYNTIGWSNGKIMIKPGIDIQVEAGKKYTSAEFKKIIPADAPSHIFRYKTYVGEDSKVSANVSGIYGLMDEFSAYHNGVLAMVVAAENAMKKGDTALASRFINQANGTYKAFYEFRLFIAWYLHYAKSNYPEIHQDMMANTNLRIAFTLLDDAFKHTLLRYDNVMISTSKSSGGASSYAGYEVQQMKTEKIYLDEFRMKNVNENNYQNFLKNPS
ncbi:MAG: hypothetical protein Fur0041_15020 [Bacteroidia bacterium]